MDDIITRDILIIELAKVTGDLETSFNNRMDAMEHKFDTKFDKLFTIMDGIAKRIDDDDKERAAMTHQLNRHDTWIGQLADKTKTKLQPGR